MWKDLMNSKKVKIALIGFIGAIVGHFGLDLTPDQLAVLLSPIYVLLGGQAIADMGKEKAKVEVEAKREGL